MATRDRGEQCVLTLSIFPQPVTTRVSKFDARHEGKGTIREWQRTLSPDLEHLFRNSESTLLASPQSKARPPIVILG